MTNRSFRKTFYGVISSQPLEEYYGYYNALFKFNKLIKLS